MSMYSTFYDYRHNNSWCHQLIDNPQHGLKDMLKENTKSVESAMKGYQTSLDTISEVAKRETTSEEDRRFYAEKMVIIADKMAALDAENKRHHEKMAQYVGGVIGVCLIIGSAILGVNIKGTRIPRV